MLRIGEIVRTSYGSGPYRITMIDGPCTCPEYIKHLDGDETPSEPHYHLTCAGIEHNGSFYLNGFRPDGTSVWNKDSLIFDGPEKGETPDLFAIE